MSRIPGGLYQADARERYSRTLEDRAPPYVPTFSNSLSPAAFGEVVTPAFDFCTIASPGAEETLEIQPLFEFCVS
jgi:hypothetical protein